MPILFQVMKSNVAPGDTILEQPPSGKGATLLIRYRLPRTQPEEESPIRMVEVLNNEASEPKIRPTAGANQPSKEHRPIPGSLGLVSCTSVKADKVCTACEMYWRSTLFRKAFTYAIDKYENVGILSAKYGFLLPQDTIEPYNTTLNNMTEGERRSWADKIMNQMKTRIDVDKVSRVYFHAGKNYRTHLARELRSMGKEVYVPLEGYRIGEQKRWYDQQMKRKI